MHKRIPSLDMDILGCQYDLEEPNISTLVQVPCPGFPYILVGVRVTLKFGRR